MEVSTSTQTKEISQQRVSFKTAWALFALLCALSVGLWYKTLVATFQLAMRADAYSQILLAIPLSAFLLAIEFRKRKAVAIPARLPGTGLLLLSLGLALLGLNGTRSGFAAADVRLAVEMSALVLWCIGAFVLCFGTGITRRCLFPLLFLLWLVPMPHAVVDAIVAILQRGTASLTHAMLVAVGIPVRQQGDLLSLPGLTIEVAAECSSIRSSLLLVMSSMVMAYLLLRSFWGRSIVILLAAPIAVAKNGLRVFTLSVLSAYVNPDVMDGHLHRQGGVLFLAIALLLLLALIWVIRQIEAKRMRSISSIDRTQAPIPVTPVTQRTLV